MGHMRIIIGSDLTGIIRYPFAFFFSPPSLWSYFQEGFDKSYFYYYIFFLFLVKTPYKYHRLPQPHTNTAHFRPQDGTLCAYKWSSTMLPLEKREREKDSVSLGKPWETVLTGFSISPATLCWTRLEQLVFSLCKLFGSSQSHCLRLKNQSRDHCPLVSLLTITKETLTRVSEYSQCFIGSVIKMWAFKCGSCGKDIFISMSLVVLNFLHGHF